MAFIGKITDTSGVTGLIGSTLYGTCDTAAATAAKVVTLSDFDKLMVGITVHVRFKYSNTVANPTLNINSTGAKAIARYGIDGTIVKPGTTVTESWPAGAIIAVTYVEVSSTGYWVLNDQPALTTTTVNSVTAGTAISADDITAWNAGSPTVIATETKTIPNVTSVGSAPTLGTAFTIPNVTAAGTAPSMTKSNVEFYGVDTINNAIPSATISEGVLTFGTPTATITKTAKKTATYISAWSAGSATTLGTAFTVPNVTSVGSAPTLGTAISVESVKTNTAGVAPTLTYTSVSITPYTSSSKTVVAPKT